MIRRITLAILCVLTLSCTRTAYVPVERVRTEYRDADTTAIINSIRAFIERTRQKETASDSVLDHEKETVVLNDRGDTTRHDRERIVYVSSRREKELEHTVAQKDSIISALRTQLASVKADSIPVPYPVERKLTRWEQTKIDFGGVAIGCLVSVVCIAVIWLIGKNRKQ